MNLVEEYYMLVSEVVSNKESVHDNKTAEEHNNKVNRMCAIAMIIEQAAPELKSDFFKLISNENSEIRLWVAHHILEYMNYDRYFRKCALREILLRLTRIPLKMFVQMSIIPPRIQPGRSL